MVFIDFNAEYWTIFDPSFNNDTSFTKEASTNYCLRCSSAPIKNEANALILA